LLLLLLLLLLLFLLLGLLLLLLLGLLFLLLLPLAALLAVLRRGGLCQHARAHKGCGREDHQAFHFPSMGANTQS